MHLDRCHDQPWMVKCVIRIIESNTKHTRSDGVQGQLKPESGLKVFHPQFHFQLKTTYQLIGDKSNTIIDSEIDFFTTRKLIIFQNFYFGFTDINRDYKFLISNNVRQIIASLELVLSNWLGLFFFFQYFIEPESLYFNMKHVFLRMVK